jgi:protein-L-isoaspartate(D-aspartate) O-methyltransferase
MYLVERLIASGYLQTVSVIAAFRQVDRRDFVRAEDVEQSDINAPLPIGSGQTISQPLTVALMLEWLQPQPGNKILDIGSGSGWTTALLAHIVGPTGVVYGLEILPELVAFANQNTAKYPDLKARIINQVGNGYTGLPAQAPFDRIMVSAAALSLPPTLRLQLQIGGRLVVPVGRPHQIQTIIVEHKISAQKITSERHDGFIFVPLIN